MAIKPKKVISSRGEIGVGGGSRGASSSGSTIKKEVMLKKKAAVKPKTPVKIKSGGDIKPAGRTFKRSSLPINISTKRPGLFEEGFVSTQYIKSGGNIKPATSKVTTANTSAGVGKAPSKADVKWSMETAKLGARKGKTVKINSAPKRTSGNR